MCVPVKRLIFQFWKTQTILLLCRSSFFRFSPPVMPSVRSFSAAKTGVPAGRYGKEAPPGSCNVPRTGNGKLNRGFIEGNLSKAFCIIRTGYARGLFLLFCNSRYSNFILLFTPALSTIKMTCTKAFSRYARSFSVLAFISRENSRCILHYTRRNFHS